MDWNNTPSITWTFFGSTSQNVDALISPMAMIMIARPRRKAVFLIVSIACLRMRVAVFSQKDC
ncbi:hypothetical protein PC116_g23442 [Phytophthora cactorum]|nr:hypothetical protein PC116_g23442 [Phytophthora cactorum]